MCIWFIQSYCSQISQIWFVFSLFLLESSLNVFCCLAITVSSFSFLRQVPVALKHSQFQLCPPLLVEYSFDSCGTVSTSVLTQYENEISWDDFLWLVHLTGLYFVHPSNISIFHQFSNYPVIGNILKHALLFRLMNFGHSGENLSHLILMDKFPSCFLFRLALFSHKFHAGEFFMDMWAGIVGPLTSDFHLDYTLKLSLKV